ncbi:MAG: hypothetical protein NVS1B13_06600 [Flavisolibacter sp.]
MEPITILNVHSLRLVNECFTERINADKRFKVIKQASNEMQMVQYLEEGHFDIITLHIEPTELGKYSLGIQLLLQKNKKIVIIAPGVNLNHASEMMHLGVQGYITFNSSAEECLFAISHVHQGRKYWNDEIATLIYRGVATVHVEKNLSLRQLQVINLIKKGLTSKEIARQLNLSVHTVGVHRYNISKTLGIKNSASLVDLYS